MDLLKESPETLVKELEALGTRRAFFVFGSAPHASHPALEPLLQSILGSLDAASHEALFLELGAHTGALFAAFVHRTRRGQAAGGLRHWEYATLGEFLSDGLRLSKAMTRKNALAGLWWGGGKGLILRQRTGDLQDAAYRAQLYQEYGSFVTSLRGLYVTAEDVGTQPSDIASVFKTTRFVTCIPPALGGSGNPSISTATGIICAMEAALSHLGQGDLQGKKIAIQGLGNVASSMIEQLLRRGVAEIVACDVSELQVQASKIRFAQQPVKLTAVTPSDTSIFAEHCDIFAPCALGGVLNPRTIPLLNTKLVCGAANNQLADELRDPQGLRDRGIAYIPDFVANRMGIVRCANEQYGTLPEDPSIRRHFGRTWENSVYLITEQVLNFAIERGITSSEAANQVADEMSEEEHPIWGHRGKLILDSLLSDLWQLEGAGQELHTAGPSPTLRSPLVGLEREP